MTGACPLPTSNASAMPNDKRWWDYEWKRTRGMSLMVSTPHPLSYAMSLTNPRWCFNSNTASLPYFKKTWRWHLSCMGWPPPTSNRAAMANDEDGEYTPPLVLCLVTNASKAAFQPRCCLSRISRKAVSAFPDINIDSIDTTLTITLTYCCCPNK